MKKVTRREFLKDSTLAGGVLASGSLREPRRVSRGRHQVSENGLVTWWSFDESTDDTVLDRVGQIHDTASGHYKFISGIDGSALKCDGFTTCITRSARQAPALTRAFSIEAWMALAAYPWNWCPIVSQHDHERTGFYFAIGPEGEFGLHLSASGTFYRGMWRACTSEARIALKEWTHLAGTFDEEDGITVYLNGKETAKLPLRGTFVPAPEMDLLIGMNHDMLEPSHPHRDYSNLATWYALDGLLDDVKIYDRALAPGEIEQAFAARTPLPSPDFPPRVMPSGPSGPGRFGAYTTQLKYYDEWDAIWRSGEHSDIVVQFDDSPIRVVFWRGTSYSPAWVLDNGAWITDQSVEAWNEEGTFEHMNDAKCLYSHVRILENHDARIVVHWRYAPVNTANRLWRVDDKTGHACWVDEYYTFYPDGIGMRKITWTKGTLGPTRQFQETTPLCHPGQRPEDILHLDALTLVNLEGDTHTYTWPGDAASRHRLRPDNANIEVVNFRSKAKPFLIFEPGSRIQVLGGSMRKGIYSVFPMCNHWPVAQIPSDGRTCLAPDRASSFSPAICRPVVHDGSDGRNTTSWLCGTTQKPAKELARLGRSWSHPPTLNVTQGEFASEGYDPTERAYVINHRQPDRGSILSFQLAGSSVSPIVNPAIVIKGWGSHDAKLDIDGEPIEQGAGFRTGSRAKLEGDDLIVWLQVESNQPMSIQLAPA